MSLWPDGNGFAGQIWPAGRSLENHGLKRTPEQAQCFLRYKAEVRPYLISQTDRKIIRSQGFHFICDQHQQDFVRGFNRYLSQGRLLNLWSMAEESFLTGHSLVLLKLSTFCNMNLSTVNEGSS